MAPGILFSSRFVAHSRVVTPHGPRFPVLNLNLTLNLEGLPFFFLLLLELQTDSSPCLTSLISPPEQVSRPFVLFFF